MKRLLLAAFLALAALSAEAAERMVVTVTHDLKAARPAETIAVPWAEVWIDGQRVGETPIGNLAVPLGSHEIIFRHPDLGEQRHTALVTLKEPTRLSVDLRKP